MKAAPETGPNRSGTRYSGGRQAQGSETLS